MRISSDTRGEALGVARQEADCRALAARLGWEVVEVYSDNDVSAFSGKARPSYERMLADVQSGRVGGILAYAPDRLYRRLADLSRFIDAIRDSGASVHTVAAGEVDLNTAAGRQTAGLLGVIAAGESDRMGERIRRKLAENAREGKPHGGNRPYGWEVDRLTIRESEADVIREAASRIIAGEPMRSIMKDLNARGILTATGRPWTHATLLGVVRASRHAGLRQYHDQVIEGQWPAIIPPETWRAMRRVLDDPSRVTTPGRGGRLHLLSVLARCGLCGGPMIVSKSRGADVYKCRTSHVSRSREHVDKYVSELVIARLSKPDAVDLLTAPDDEPARQEALEEAERVRQQLDDAAAMFASGLIDARQLTTITGQLRPTLAELEASAAPPADRARMFGGLIGAADVRAEWEELTQDVRRMVVDSLMDIKISPGGRGNVFRPDGIDATWKL